MAATLSLDMVGKSLMIHIEELAKIWEVCMGVGGGRAGCRCHLMCVWQILTENVGQGVV